MVTHLRGCLMGVTMLTVTLPGGTPLGARTLDTLIKSQVPFDALL